MKEIFKSTAAEDYFAKLEREAKENFRRDPKKNNTGVNANMGSKKAKK